MRIQNYTSAIWTMISLNFSLRYPRHAVMPTTRLDVIRGVLIAYSLTMHANFLTTVVSALIHNIYRITVLLPNNCTRFVLPYLVFFWNVISSHKYNIYNIHMCFSTAYSNLIYFFLHTKILLCFMCIQS